VPWDADAPTRAAAEETILRRDNLISLITQTDLIREWDRHARAVAQGQGLGDGGGHAPRSDPR